ncbi:hypothetical protein CJ195_17685 [Bacillus sp. UMB0899]|nr:hypothetical protein CJ195_17685 [Bacillus sp. UMB0899]
MEEELRKERLDIDALNVLLRKKNVFAVSEVDYAILEIDGTLSVMKKEPMQPLTKSDIEFKKSTTNVYPIATSVISDEQNKKRKPRKIKYRSAMVRATIKTFWCRFHIECILCRGSEGRNTIY